MGTDFFSGPLEEAGFFSFVFSMAMGIRLSKINMYEFSFHNILLYSQIIFLGLDM